MSLLVVGSIGIDDIETPTAKRERIYGGSAIHFSFAASFFTTVRLVGVAGDDWPSECTEALSERGVDTIGLQIKPGGKTFRWGGKYSEDMNERETLFTELNVLGEFDPVVPELYRSCNVVFLANGVPQVQHKVMDQLPGAHLTVADTMDLWINMQRESLDALLKRLSGLVLNDAEARLLTGEHNLVTAGHRAREMGPKFVVIKKGEHGAMFFSEHETYVMPAYPTENVVDPTGAGDSFAGGMMGYLAEKNAFDPKTLKEALAYGMLTASFNVEDFSSDRMLRLTREELDQRMAEYRKMLSF